VIFAGYIENLAALGSSVSLPATTDSMASSFFPAWPQ
jgi:hypothetical protein